jgi:hypothetical protein
MMNNSRQDTLLPSVLGAIGNTPLVELSRLTRGLEGRILAKLEYLNPGFSKKDRIALQMIEEAEADGRLKSGQTVVELTSGNTGTGLSIVCAVKGSPFVAVMSRGNSMERARMMKALGAEVVLIDQLPESKPGQVSGGDLALVEEAAQRITKNGMLSAQINSIWKAVPAVIIFIQCLKSFNRQMEKLTCSVISSAQAVRLEDVPQRSRSIIPMSCVMLLNRPTRRYWQANPSSIQITAFKVEDIPWQSCLSSTKTS